MIIRIWHGWTLPENADSYENILKREVFKGIEDKILAGYKKIELLRRDLSNEVEFVTIMRFNSIDDIKQFVGEDYEQAYVPPAARKRLKRFDHRSQHYELREALDHSA